MDCTEKSTNETRLNPKFYPLPKEFVYKNTYWPSWASEDIIKRVENDFEFFPDDVLVATYPRSGTTVLQEMVWLICNNVDAETASRKIIIERFPFLDENFDYNYSEYNYFGRVIDIAHLIKRPRFFKTHLHYGNLENQIDRNPDMKILVSLRNPKDTAVSMFHFYRGVNDYGPFKGTWDDFFERWIDGWIGGGDWLQVTTEWWKARFRKNIKIIFYEDIIYKRKEMIKEISEFLNKTLTDQELNAVVHLTEFKTMKKNSSTNISLLDEAKVWMFENFQFIRKGEVGDWKNFFTEEQNKKMDAKYKNVLDSLGLNFRYE